MAQWPYDRLSSDPLLLSFVERMFEGEIPLDADITGDYLETTNRKECGPAGSGCRRMHFGTDIQWGGKGGEGMRGTWVYAPFSGTVSRSSRRESHDC